MVATTMYISAHARLPGISDSNFIRWESVQWGRLLTAYPDNFACLVEKAQRSCLISSHSSANVQG